MNTAAIRLARQGDLERMVAIEIQAADLFSLETLPAGLGRSGSRVETQRAISSSLAWVAEVPASGVVGFLAAQIVEGCLHVAEMDVLPSHGRQGIGGRLLEHACDHAWRRKLTAATLTTFEHVPWNAPFYAKHGFVALSEPHGFDHLRRALANEHSLGLRSRVAMVRHAALP